MVGLLVAVPGLLFVSRSRRSLAFSGVRCSRPGPPSSCCPRSRPWPPSAGLIWVLSPLLAGLAFAETHDLTRLLHFPVPLPDARALVARGQPRCSRLCSGRRPGPGPRIALARRPARPRLPAPRRPRACCFSSWPRPRSRASCSTPSRATAGSTTACSSSGLGARLPDQPLPILLLTGGRRFARRLLSWSRPRRLRAVALRLGRAGGGPRRPRRDGPGLVLRHRCGLWSPLGAVALSAALVGRIYRGELDLGTGRRAGVAAARCGCRARSARCSRRTCASIWRDPRSRRSLFTGLAGPLLSVPLLEGDAAGPGPRRAPR